MSASGSRIFLDFRLFVATGEDSCRCQTSPVTEVLQSLLQEPRSKAGDSRKASGGGRAFKPTEANSRFRETGRIPCPTHELPYEREKIPCPRRNKFPAVAGSRIWEFACNTLGLWHELASGSFEPAVNLEKFAAKFAAIGNSNSNHPTLKTPH
jgi:hypothetical protein